MQRVGIRETRERIAQLIDAVARGEEILITRRGKPVARLVPVSGHTNKVSQFPDRAHLRAKIPPAKKLSSDLINDMRENRG